MIGEMLRSDDFENELILDVAQVLDLNFKDYITAFAGYPDSSENQTAIERFHKLVKIQTAEEYESCLEFLRPYVMEDGKMSFINKYLYNYIESQLKKVTPYVYPPSYLIKSKKEIIWNDEIGENDPTSIPYMLPDSIEAADILTKKILTDLASESMSSDEIKNVWDGIRKEYDNSSDDRMRIRFLQPVYLEILPIEEIGDVERFRQWGPFNPYISSSKTEQHQSSRMLTCIKFVIEDEEDYFHLPSNEDDYMSFDWFTGNCQDEECKKRIRWYHHAVRIPERDGGWFGCFCSWNCAFNLLKSEGKLIDQVSPNPIRKRLLEIFIKQINEIGIYDRPFPSPDEEENEDPDRFIDEDLGNLILQALEDAKLEDEEY